MSSREPVSALDPFLEVLRAHHFAAGLDRRLRLIQAFDVWKGEFTPHRLRTLLCPILATNADEQRLFCKLFDQHSPHFSSDALVASAVVREVTAATAAEMPRPLAKAQRHAKRAKGATAFVVLTVAIMGFSLWLFRSRVPSPPPRLQGRPATVNPEGKMVATQQKQRDSAVSYSYGFSANPAPPGIAWRWSVVLLIPALLWALMEGWAWRRRKAILARGARESPTAASFRRMAVPVRAAAQAGFAATAQSPPPYCPGRASAPEHPEDGGRNGPRHRYAGIPLRTGVPAARIHGPDRPRLRAGPPSHAL